jgi:hypothetical protein
MEDIIPDITSMPQAIVVQRGQTAKFHCEATVSNSYSNSKSLDPTTNSKRKNSDRKTITNKEQDL